MCEWCPLLARKGRYVQGTLFTLWKNRGFLQSEGGGSTLLFILTFNFFMQWALSLWLGCCNETLFIFIHTGLEQTVVWSDCGCACRHTAIRVVMNGLCSGAAHGSREGKKQGYLCSTLLEVCGAGKRRTGNVNTGGKRASQAALFFLLARGAPAWVGRAGGAGTGVGGRLNQAG